MFSLQPSCFSHPSLVLGVGACDGDGGAPHAAVGPGLTGTSPPAGKRHTRPGHVGECAMAAGDLELGLAVPFPWALPFPRPYLYNMYSIGTCAPSNLVFLHLTTWLLVSSS